jgi:hypothetical protein
MEPMPRTAASRGTLVVMLIAALIQGWALYALHRAIDVHEWPATKLGWLLGFYDLAVLGPVTLELLAKHIRRPALWVLGTLIGTAIFYFGWYHGTAIAERGTLRWVSSGEFLPVAFVLCVWWLHVLPFVQSRLAAGHWTLDYPRLFAYAWRNVVVLAEGGLFTGLFWLILWLWGSLFHMLGIDFFHDLFERAIFAYPVTSVVFGCAILLIGSIDRLVSAVLEQVLNVLKWLAPVAGVLLVLFTLALVGKLPHLIATGSRAIGAAFLLWLAAVVVLLLNAAYRDGTVERPYPKWLEQALRFAVPLSVIIALTAIYALVVRTTHFGLTVERVWGFIVAGAALMYAGGYTVAALRGGPWLQGVARVNVGVALALIAVIAGALSPILSPYRLAADSQYRLIREGRYRVASLSGIGITPFRYLGFYAGRYGRRRLEQLARLRNAPGSDAIRTLAAQTLAQSNPWGSAPVLDAAQLVAHLPVYPAGRTLDSALAKRVVADWTHSGLPLTDRGVAGVFADLNGDGVDEFILLRLGGGPVYQSRSGQWVYVGRAYPVGVLSSWPELLGEIARGDFAATPPRWKELSVGSHRFRIDAQP